MKDGLILIIAGMPALFASSGLPDVEGDWFLKLLACAGCLLWIWNQGKAAFGKNKSQTPQPLIVEQLKAMATRDEMEALEKKVEEGFRTQSAANLTSVGKVHARIDKTSTKIDTLIGEVRGLKSTQDILLSNKVNTI